jgi:hypothetical protein
MGNKMPQTAPLAKIEMAPGNVLIDIYRGLSYSGSGNGGNSCHKLYWVCSENEGQKQRS